MLGILSTSVQRRLILTSLYYLDCDVAFCYTLGLSAFFFDFASAFLAALYEMAMLDSMSVLLREV